MAVSSQAPRALEGGEHRAQALVGQPLEVHVVVEVAEPGRSVLGVDVAPQTVLLVPAPLSVCFGLGVKVVVEVGRQPVDHLGVGLVEGGEGVVLLPGGSLQHATDGGDIVGMAFAIARLVDREPHHVVGVDQGDGEEPGPDDPPRYRRCRWRRPLRSSRSNGRRWWR